MADRRLLPSSTSRTLPNYERLACCYDAWASWERPYVEAGFAMLQLRHRDDYLEVGCGTGRLLARAAHFGGRCVGFDLSPNMCRVARRHCVGELGASEVAEGEGEESQKGREGQEGRVRGEYGGRVRVVCGDAVKILEASSATAMPRATTMVDAAAIMFTLELFDEADAIRLLRGIRNRLRPGGISGEGGESKPPSRLVIVAMSSDVKNKRSCSMCCYAWCHRNCSCVVDCRPIDVSRWVETAGFKVHERRVMGMYGLAVELVEARLP
jgi:ubiquinone/menaquinone biosynthesis C-methylase UbiE